MSKAKRTQTVALMGKPKCRIEASKPTATGTRKRSTARAKRTIALKLINNTSSGSKIGKDEKNVSAVESFFG